MRKIATLFSVLIFFTNNKVKGEGFGITAKM